MTTPKRHSRHPIVTFFGLSPDVTMGELLFGLIMVLTFTLGAGIVASDDPDEARLLILAAIGCNIAWGIIDAVFYVMGLLFVRGRRSRLLVEVQKADRPTAVAMIREELEEQLAPVTTEVDRAQLYERIHDALSETPASSAAIGAADLKQAFGVFLLVSLTTIPAVFPFIFIDDPWQALRLSNGLLIALIFFVGYRWAGYTQATPWRAGLGLMLIGIVLVVIAIALGG